MKEFERAQDKISKFDTLISLKDGRVAAIDKRTLNESPFFLLTDPPFNNIIVPANGVSKEAAMRSAGEGPLQLTLLGAVRDSVHGPVTVRMYIKDGSQTIPISNVPLHIDTLFGPGGKMYPLPEGAYIDENRALSVSFTNLNEDDETQSRICGVGAKYTQLQADPSLARVKERLAASEFLSSPQFYGVNDGSISLAACAEATYQVEIQGDHNFELHQLSAISTGPFSINIIDMSKKESIINAPRNGTYRAPSTLLFGDASYPYRFHEPILYFAGQRLLIDIVDTSGDVNQIYLTFGGVALKVRKWS